MSDDAGGLELRSVVQRFQDSTDALGQLRERLRILAETEDQQTSAAASIQGASDELRGQVTAMHAIVESLISAVNQTKSAMEAAAGLLDGSNIMALRSDVQAVGATTADALRELRRESGVAATELAELKAGQAESLSNLRRVVQLLEEDLQRSRSELAACTHAGQQLAAKIASIPEKTRRKLGL